MKIEDSLDDSFANAVVHKHVNMQTVESHFTGGILKYFRFQTLIICHKRIMKVAAATLK